MLSCSMWEAIFNQVSNYTDFLFWKYKDRFGNLICGRSWENLLKYAAQTAFCPWVGQYQTYWDKILR